jgi:hypothetical protein
MQPLWRDRYTLGTNFWKAEVGHWWPSEPNPILLRHLPRLPKNGIMYRPGVDPERAGEDL